MDATLNIALVISILMNLLTLGLGILIIIRRGFAFSLIRRLLGVVRRKSKLFPLEEIPYYRDKTSHFSRLLHRESEVVFLGDSLTDYGEWSELFRDIPLKNRGISGDRTDGVLNRLDEIVESNPKSIFLLIGINDIIQGRRNDEVLKTYCEILETLKSQLSGTTVFIQSVLPTNTTLSVQKLGVKINNNQVVELNNRLKELAKTFSFPYIDLFSAFSDNQNELNAQYTTDGVHLNGQGYWLWKECIEKYVVNSK
ncbi:MULTISPECIES: GDSL-type esterase/lipase family protein [unclassified Coleofasciculus]|uniref:GDSL-type esterase/lipase family protein n=1 Tax=unclassified Coleofasciculus TaxID=2692782 RepID=UPI0018800C69|nr:MULTISPECIES: GDSL-type esterase/lipase family protein [unclassified Coleofasciculus]MBE9129629.1 G-D-S-L family lipolytic protein [Coleofasciculus sp. LEGE 07081]MBE9149799.1 G-D-S-L family lipolytic protein [Coleofasciculus sp. LEGE 07092]